MKEQLLKLGLESTNKIFNETENFKLQIFCNLILQSEIEIILNYCKENNSKFFITTTYSGDILIEINKL